MSEWGVDTSLGSVGGLKKIKVAPVKREIHLLQRKTTKPGVALGKTTGWIHRMVLKKSGVKIYSGVKYLGITDEGLGIHHNGTTRMIAVDNVVICAGQESELGLAEELKKNGLSSHIIGGALKAGELDAQRAISQGMELADTL